MIRKGLKAVAHPLEDYLEDFDRSGSEAAELQQRLREENRALLRDIKRLLARRLHPDYCAADEAERTLRAAIFQEIWPELESLARGRA